MKKILFIVASFLITILVVLIVISNSRSPKEQFYSIPQSRSYVYEEERKMQFEIYSNVGNPFIKYTDLNQYRLTYQNNRYTLEDIEIEIIEQNKVYIIVINCNCIQPVGGIFEEEVELEIINSKYTVNLNLGKLSILDPTSYTLLSFNSLYPTYGYVNQELYLVGINITFSQKYNEMKNFQIGTSGYGDLKLALEDKSLPNEVNIKDYIPDYNILSNPVKTMNMTSDMYFIPIVYESLAIIKQGYITMELDGTLYYIDTLNFFVNEIDFNDYPTSVREGVITYA